MLTFNQNLVEELFAAINTDNNERVLALIVTDNRILTQTNERGLTALMDATIGKKYDAMRLLLLHGANVNQQDEDGWTAKSWAVFVQDTEALKILSKTSVLSNTDDISGALFGSLAI